jgi:hypothetical protein
MQIKDYLNEVLNALSTSPFIESQNLTFEERPPDAAFITGTVTFLDSSKLHFKEFMIFRHNDIEILKYGYNYLAKNGALIFRYDNALDPKAKKLSTYPEHKHTPKKLIAAKRPSLREIFKEISDSIEKLADLQAIDVRKKESKENYDAYSRKRKRHLRKDKE